MVDKKALSTLRQGLVSNQWAGRVAASGLGGYHARPSSDPHLLMKPASLRADLLAGLTSSFALVPECIAFALVAQNGNIYYGLWYPIIVAGATFVIGLFFLPETKDRDIYAHD